MNKILLIGNVGHTPEVRTVGESKVANFSLGVTERGYTKKDGTRLEDKTEWFNCRVWRGQAEFVEKYVKKGDKLLVDGKVNSRKYTGNDGVEKTVWDVNVASIELLTPKSASAADGMQRNSAPEAPETPVESTNDLPF